MKPLSFPWARAEMQTLQVSLMIIICLDSMERKDRNSSSVGNLQSAISFQLVFMTFLLKTFYGNSTRELFSSRDM